MPTSSLGRSAASTRCTGYSAAPNSSRYRSAASTSAAVAARNPPLSSTSIANSPRPRPVTRQRRSDIILPSGKSRSRRAPTCRSARRNVPSRRSPGPGPRDSLTPYRSTTPASPHRARRAARRTSFRVRVAFGQLDQLPQDAAHDGCSAAAAAFSQQDDRRELGRTRAAVAPRRSPSASGSAPPATTASPGGEPSTVIRTSPLRLSPRIVIEQQRTTAPGVLEVDPEPAREPRNRSERQLQDRPPGESLRIGSGAADPANARGPESARAAARTPPISARVRATSRSDFRSGRPCHARRRSGAHVRAAATGRTRSRTVGQPTRSGVS